MKPSFKLFVLGLLLLIPFGSFGTALAAPSTGTAAVASASLGGCPMFPANNIWNRRIDTLPVHAKSDTWINSIGRSTGLHMDFGAGNWDGGPIGIPINLAASTVTGVRMVKSQFDYGSQSDQSYYPIVAGTKIEFGSDHHILMVKKGVCKLYELYAARKVNGIWRAGSGAVWDLNSNALRPAGWTSADAAGLPITPGLLRPDEVAAGQIKHAIRFTISNTAGYIWPARHLTAAASSTIPPMGARFRLKASFNISSYSARMQVILVAMKKYGIIVADNGSNWYISGIPSSNWNNDELHTLDNITGNAFEAVNESSLMISPDSGQAAP